MSGNQIFIVLIVVSILALFLLATIGDVLIERAKAKRDAEIAKAKARVSEDRLFERYQKTRADVERAARQK